MWPDVDSTARPAEDGFTLCTRASNAPSGYRADNLQMGPGSETLTALPVPCERSLPAKSVR